MSYHLLAIPFVNNPVGWAVLGTAGYLTYRAGKKAGLKSEDQATKENLFDRTVKGTMKTAYKTKMKIDDSLSSTKEKYSEMWNEAQAEAAEKA